MISGIGVGVHVCQSCLLCSPAMYLASMGLSPSGSTARSEPVTRPRGPQGAAPTRADEIAEPRGAAADAGAAGASPGPGRDPAAAVADTVVSYRAVAAGSPELDPEQQRQVTALRARDAEVRAHEAAHAAVAGSLAGAVRYTYQRGPDGALYAIGGEVPVRLSEGRTPEETLARARQVRAAALAPASPSGADRAVAAAAAALEARAQQELAASRSAEPSERGDAPSAGSPSPGARGVTGSGGAPAEEEPVSAVDALARAQFDVTPIQVRRATGVPYRAPRAALGRGRASDERGAVSNEPALNRLAPPFAIAGRRVTEAYRLAAASDASAGTLSRVAM